MSLQFQMIGTGSAFAKKYYNNNALITTESFQLMIDFGITAPAALYRMNLPYDRIDGVLITHIHADHIGGLEEFAFQMKYVYGKRPKLYIAETLVDNLWTHSLRGGLENVSEGETCLEHYFDVTPLQENLPTAISPDISVELIRTEHIAGKLSYSVFVNEFIFYTADMKFDPDLLARIEQERHCRYILHDCQFTEPGYVHATLNELLTLPEALQQKIYLMHYGDDMEDYIGKTGKMSFIAQQQLYEFN